MEIVDELMTPGCPNCAVKHLSAALAHWVEQGSKVSTVDYEDEVSVLLARAYINLVEASEGYRSHLYFAIGLLERAEEFIVSSARLSDEATDIREIRVGLILNGYQGIPMAAIRLLTRLTPAALIAGHVREAKRELPGYDLLHDTPVTVEKILEALDLVREEFFSFTAVVEDNNKEDNTMACSTAKKAACKGGKCAGSKKSGKK